MTIAWFRMLERTGSGAAVLPPLDFRALRFQAMRRLQPVAQLTLGGMLP
jgi:hypothetical protein